MLADICTTSVRPRRARRAPSRHVRAGRSSNGRGETALATPRAAAARGRRADHQDLSRYCRRPVGWVERRETHRFSATTRFGRWVSLRSTILRLLVRRNVRADPGSSGKSLLRCCPRQQSERRLMPTFPNLPSRLRLILWFSLISAVIGASYAHIQAVMDGSPFFTLDGVPRGVIIGLMIAVVLTSFEVFILT